MNKKRALTFRRIMDEDNICNSVHRVTDDDYIVFWSMMEGDHLIDHGCLDKSSTIEDLPFPRAVHPYYNTNKKFPQKIEYFQSHRIPRIASEAEFKAIADANRKEFGGEYEPEWVAVWNGYISDGPGYTGWVAVAVGGEPCYVTSYTKDSDGVIKVEADSDGVVKIGTDANT